VRTLPLSRDPRYFRPHSINKIVYYKRAINYFSFKLKSSLFTNCASFNPYLFSTTSTLLANLTTVKEPLDVFLYLDCFFLASFLFKPLLLGLTAFIVPSFADLHPS
jgi:hypothetical protein